MVLTTGIIVLFMNMFNTQAYQTFEVMMAIWWRVEL